MISTVRTRGAQGAIIIDAKQAFYKTVLHHARVQLSSGRTVFTSDRMCFGLKFGPAGLDACLGRILDQALESGLCEDNFLCKFVDDIILLGDPDTLLRTVARVLRAMQLAGYDVQGKKFQPFSEDSIPFTTPTPNPFPIPVEPTSTGTFLGMKVTLTQGEIVINCDRSCRCKRARVHLDNLRTKPTKRLIFALAGLIGYDPTRCHPEARYVADTLRSLCGAVYSTQSFDDEMNLETFSKPQRRVYYDFIRQATEIISKGSREGEECHHSTPIRRPGDTPSTFELCTDASLTGGGWSFAMVGKDGEKRHILGEDVWRWRKAERNYHSNRRELIALFNGIRAVTGMMEYYDTRSVTDKSNRPSIQILCDNRSALAWVEYSDLADTKAMERRPILRLISAVVEELTALRKYANVKLDHIQGSSNTRADWLSRLYDIKFHGLSLGDILEFAHDTARLEDNELYSYDPETPGQGILHDEDAHIQPGPDPLSAPLANDLESTKSLFSDLAPAVLHPDRSMSQTIAIADHVFTIRNRSSSPTTPVTTPERLAAQVNSIDRLTHSWHYFRIAFEAFRFLRRCKLDPDLAMKPMQWAASNEPITPVPDDRTLPSYVLALQLHDPDHAPTIASLIDGKKDVLPPCGPLFWKDGCLQFRSGDPNGAIRWKLFVPRNAKIFRKLLIRHAHHVTEHSSFDRTLAEIRTTFHTQYINDEIRTTLSECLRCQIAKTTRSWDAPPTITSINLSRLLNSPAYTRAGIDFLALGDHAKALTITCLATKHTTWLTAEAEDMDTTLKILRRFQVQRGGLDVIVCDRASYFASNRFAQECYDRLGAKVELLSARSPFEGGAFEKLHDLGLERLRHMTASQHGKLKGVPTPTIQDLLDRVTLLLNTRPLHRTHKSLPDSDSIEPLTPDLLAYGFNRKLQNIPTLMNPNIEPDANELPPPLTTILKMIRGYYLEHWWSKLKERTLVSIRQKCHTKTDGTPTELTDDDFVTGDPVLIYTGTARKLDFHYVMCQILQRKGKTTYWVLHREGIVREENFFNMKKIIKCPILNHEFENETPYGPSRFGQAIRVEFFCFRQDGTRLPDTKWFRGFIGQYDSEADEYKVHWTSGEPSTTFNLRESRWFILRGRGGGHDTLSEGRRNEQPDFDSFTLSERQRATRGSTDPLAIDYHSDPISTPRTQEIHEYLGVEPQDIFGPRVRPSRRK